MTTGNLDLKTCDHERKRNFGWVVVQNRLKTVTLSAHFNREVTESSSWHHH